MGDRVVHVQQVDVVQLRNFRHSTGQGEVIWRKVEQGITGNIDFVVVDVRLRPGQPDRLLIGDEVDLMATLSQFHTQFCGDYSTASVRGITRDPDAHLLSK